MLLSKPGVFQYEFYDQNKQLEQQQEQFNKPIDIIKEQITTKILNIERDNKIYFLKAGTGAGKSTLFISELFKITNGKSILCTKPRIALCHEAVHDLPKYYPEFINGFNIGYKVGSDNRSPQASPNVIFMTTQILTNMLSSNSDEIYNYRFCIIDEVHEMSDQMIQLIFGIRKYIYAHLSDPRCPIFICMSATIDLEAFKKYFGFQYKVQDIGLLRPAPMRYHVDYYYIDDSNLLAQRIEKSLALIKKIYKERDIPHQDFRHIIFMTKGAMPTKYIMQQCERYDFGFDKMVFSYASSDIQKVTDNYTKYNDKTYKGVKIIVSTSLLEAGANIPNLYTCVDTGIRQQQIYNNILDYEQMQASAISQSSYEQRKGRVGREGPGIFIGLYSEKQQFPKDPNPIVISSGYFIAMLKFIKTIMPEKYDPNFHLNLQDLQLIIELNANIILATYNKLQYLQLILPDGRITYDFWLLLQSDYPADTFVVYVCKYYKCTPFATNLVATLWTRDGQLKSTSYSATSIDMLYHLLQLDFSYFKPDSLGDFFQSCGEKSLDTKIRYPLNMSYDKNGPIKAMHYLTGKTVFMPQQQSPYQDRNYQNKNQQHNNYRENNKNKYIK